MMKKKTLTKIKKKEKLEMKNVLLSLSHRRRVTKMCKDEKEKNIKKLDEEFHNLISLCN